MTVQFDTYEAAADMIVICEKCKKNRLFHVVTSKKDRDTVHSLERCNVEECKDICRCAIPTLTTKVDFGDISGIIRGH